MISAMYSAETAKNVNVSQRCTVVKASHLNQERHSMTFRFHGFKQERLAVSNDTALMQN